MSIDHQAGLSIYVPEDNVRGLSSHPSQRDEIFHRIGEAIAESLDDVLRGGFERLGFLPEETCRQDNPFDVARIGGRHRGGGGARGRTRRSYLVGSFVW